MQKFLAISIITLFSFPVYAEGNYGGGLLFYIYLFTAIFTIAIVLLFLTAILTNSHKTAKSCFFFIALLIIPTVLLGYTLYDVLTS